MKFLIALFLTLACTTVFAAGKGDTGVRKPVGIPSALDTSTTNVTAAAWVQLIASTSWACSEILVHNSGTQPIKLGVGAAASEVDLGMVLPIGVTAMVPVDLYKGTRVSLRSMGSTQSSGIITFSCFQ